MRTVLKGSVTSAALILTSVGVVGSASLGAAPAFAASGHARPAKHAAPAAKRVQPGPSAPVQIGDAVAYVRDADGTVRRIR